MTQQFYDWERHGRGWAVWPTPVEMEPPCRPFPGHVLPAPPSGEDGQVETLLSRLADAFLGSGRQKARAADVGEPEPDFGPAFMEDRTGLVEFQTLLPAKIDIPREPFGQFLASLYLCREPVAFELLGSGERIGVQFVTGPADARLVGQQLRAFFPEAAFLRQEEKLEATWPQGECAVVEFGLDKEFMLPLATQRLDPFVGIAGALSDLDRDERGLFQVLFQPTRRPWAANILRAVTDGQGGDFFADFPDLSREAKRKVAAPLYAVIVRIATVAPGYDRAWDIARDLAGSLRVFANPTGNELIPLHNEEYPFDEHLGDTFRRQCRRTGMILSSDELIGLVHLPGAVVRAPSLVRQVARSKAAPKFSPEGAVHLGQNHHAGRDAPVLLPDELRLRHIHIVGATGTGKSTLLGHLIRQDLERGAGLALLDPHGDLADHVLGWVPERRWNKVVVFDPTDAEYPIGFNILAARDETEKNLLASDLVSVFARLSSAWGDQMGSVLQNAILAFLESDRGGTLIELRRFLLEPAFRDRFLTTVRDPDIVYYWRRGFGHLTGSKSIGPVLTRLETFLARKTIRHMVAQPRNRLDFGEMMGAGRIFIARLPQGLIGRENAFLLGSLLVCRFEQAAMARQRDGEAHRRPFWLYIDEFQHFVTPSMAEILSGARKYGLGLVLAHQELQQLLRDKEVASAVMNNAATRICFRVGDDDARRLAEGFVSFEAADLRSLRTGEAIARIERNDADFNLRVGAPAAENESRAGQVRESIIALSRKRYGTPRGEVEALLAAQLGMTDERPETPAKDRRDSEGATSVPSDAAAAPALRQTPPTVARQEPATSGAADEKEKTQSPPKKPLTKRAELGRGGAQHRAIVERIKAAAEGLGYRATIEKEVPDKTGSIDLALERPDRSFACEVSVTTTIDHEVGNIVKCLKADLGVVVIVMPDSDRIGRMREAASGALEPKDMQKVCFFTPDGFIERLQQLSTEDAKLPSGQERRRGYVIKRSRANLTGEERKAREREAIRVMAERMKRKPHRTSPEKRRRMSGNKNSSST